MNKLQTAASYCAQYFTVGKKYRIEVSLRGLRGIKKIKYEGTCIGVYDDSVYFNKLSNIAASDIVWSQEIERTGPDYTTYTIYNDSTHAIETTETT